MSYYRPSFAQSTGGGMSRGGRGSFSSSRGSSSYRGSSRGSSSWNSSGGYNSSRGYHGTSSRGSSSTTYRSSGYAGNSFDASRSMGKYGERTSFRGSSGEEPYRKPSYRPDPTYSRESRMSPERKRMRTESRHDVYSGGSESSLSRYNSDASFGRSKQSLASSTPFHRPTSSSGDFRKPLAPPPPPNISNSYSSSSGGYRGSGRVSSRTRYIVSGRDTTAPRRLMDYTTSTTWRSSRGAPSIRSSEYARRMRLRQITNRSTIIRTSRPIHSSSRIKRNDSDDELWGAVRDDDDDDDEDDDDNDDENEENEKESSKETSKEKKSADTSDEAKKAVDKKETDEADDAEKDEGDEDEAKDEEKKADGDAEVSTETTVKKKTPIKKVSSSKDRERSHTPEDSFPPRRFIKLVCPYCHTRCITFSRYTNHLRSARHSAAMHHVALKQKTALSRMRIAQRAEQKTIERALDEAELIPHTNFCPLCKLNYRQTKVIHRASKAHRDMKRFLMPVCKTCGITCKSPMLYETHCCSLEHIKRKAYATTNGDKSDKSEHSGDDLQNYMTIDSVGDIDDIDLEIPPPPLNASDKATSEGDNKSEGEGKSSKVKSDREKHSSSSSSKREREPQINIGVENVRKIEVHYCDLCRMYLPREEDVHDDLERILSKHCKQRTHMQRYIRYKEDKDLAKRAERLQRREMAEKEKAKDTKKTVNTSKDDGVNKSTSNDSSAKSSDKQQKSGNENDDSSLSLNESGDVAMKDLTEEEGEGVAVEEDVAAVEGEEDDDVDVKEIQEADAEAEAGDDKLWEDVDKDLGDILAGENKSCGDEEEEDDDSVVNGERYDRFKYSEKNTKSGNVGKSQPVKKVDTDIGAAEKNKVEAETAK